MPDPIHPFLMTAITSDQIADAALIKRVMLDVGPATVGALPTDSLSATPAQLVQMASKSDLGLGNVDNTSDANKPISTAVQTALDLKAATSSLSSHTGNTSNPHSVTKTQVGLGNVDNTSDANKPISSAAQLALNAKEDTQTVASTSDATLSLSTSIRSWSPQAIHQAHAYRFTMGSGGKAFYFNFTDTADAGGYNKLMARPSPNAQSALYQSNTGTDFNLVGAFLTDSDEPGVQTIPSGMCDIVIYASTGLDNVAKVKVELYSRTVGGSETLLNTYISQDFSYSAITPLTWSSLDSDPHSIGLTDRLLVKLYSARVSGSTTVNVGFSFEGDYPSRIHTTIKEGNKALSALAVPGLPSASNKILLSNAANSWSIVDNPATPIEIDYAAWIEADGNDSTASVGNPAKPYLTPQAAFDAGAKVFYIGYGSFGGIESGSLIDIAVFGQGLSRTTVSYVRSTNSSGVVVRDLGMHSVNFTTIGANGTTPPDGGGTGSGSGYVTLYNAYVVTVQSNGGNGGSSDGNNNPGNGGNGGNITATNCIFTVINSAGGNGGSSEGTGAVGANGGTISLTNCNVLSTINSAGGSGGYSSSDFGANGGNGGILTLIHSDSANFFAASGNAGGGSSGSGSAGTAGSVTARHSTLDYVSLDANGGGEGVIAGSHLFITGVASGSPTIIAVVSHINGILY